MIHPEQVTVFSYTSLPDGYAGYTPGLPIQEDNAPTWATINNTSGSDVDISLRTDSEVTFDVFVNYRADFQWKRNMFIISRFGNLDITNIWEDKRKRTVRLSGVFVARNSSAGAGVSVALRPGIYTAYARTTYGQVSVTIPEMEGYIALIFAREGIIKKIVCPTENEEDEGATTATIARDEVLLIGNTFYLPDGDIFGDELITVMYKVDA